ncbi:hypothetical protein [Sporosalibacterium faouarense]|nr:hypothetical protein [Sporosalibacterium faouarense]
MNHLQYYTLGFGLIRECLREKNMIKMLKEERNCAKAVDKNEK